MKSWGSRIPALACAVVWALGAPAAVLAQVVVNEIHYHPSNAAVQPGEDAERLQFIELHNRGAAPADLSGWSFAEGVTYTFPAGTSIPAGGYLVLAEDPSFLALRGPAIPGAVQVVKWTSGDLANNGERIRLVDAAGALQDEVAFEDAGLWPVAPDGAGPSLELVNPAFDNAMPLAWRASVANDGTPGARNSRFSEAPVILVETPARNSVVGSFLQVSVTFAEPVTGVAASGLVVDGSPATTVAGSGAGPYVFTGFAAPKSNPFTVTLAPGAIKDAQGNSFGGDTWSYFLSVPPVVINELHYNPASATDEQEFIELYNAGAEPVDVSGWRLTEFASPGCVFPAGTVIAAGGFLVCAKDPAALKAATGYQAGFQWGENDSLSNGGEVVALLNASGAVVDSVTYSDDPPWPAGPDGPDGFGPSAELMNPALDNAQGGFWRASAGPDGTPGARNSAFGEAPLVVSEQPGRGSVVVTLPYVVVTFSKPVTGVSADDLEVDGVPATKVVGTGAGPYAFTVGSPLGVGVAAIVLNPGGIQDLDGRPFAGDSWLYFVSYPRIVINEVHYHPAAGAVGAGEDPEDLQFVELYNDDAEPVDLAGYAMTEGVQVIFPPGTVIQGHGFVVVARAPAFLASKVAIPAGVPVIAWTGGDLGNGGENLRLSDPYGHELDYLDYDDTGDWPAGPDGHGPSMELINPRLDNAKSGAWKASASANGTPGATNSAFLAAPAPVIFGALHSPPIPKGGQPVTIAVNVLDDGGAAPTVTLFYRQDQDPPVAYSSSPMFDDGMHGDGAAGDGRFGAVVPGLPDGQQLDFYVQASDGVATAVAPAGHAVNDAYGQPSQTYLCKFSDEVLPADLPVYHILVTRVHKRIQEAQTGYLELKTLFDATFIDDKGNVWYNVTERYRGQSSLSKYPRSYHIDFPSNRKLETPLGFPVETLQLNGMRPQAQHLGFDLFNRAGMPAPKTAFARLRYTGINYDTCCNGQNGYYGAHVIVERMDNAFLDSQGGDVADRGLSSEGQVYRGKNDANFRWEGTDPAAYRTNAADQNGYSKYNHEDDDFWGDIIGLCDALSNTDAEHYVEHIKAHVDEDNWARYFALMVLLGNREGGIYRDTGDDYFVWMRPAGDPTNPSHPDYGTAELPGDRFGTDAKLMPWDMDSVLWDNNETIWRQNVPAIQRFLRHNAFAPIFVKAIEDLVQGPFSPAAMGQAIDAMPASVFGTKDGTDVWPETKQQFKNWVANRVAFVLSQTVDDLTMNGVPASPYEGTDPVLHLSGTLQQAGTHLVTLNGAPVTFDVYAGTWSHDLTLKPGWNPILLQAWDRNGNEKDRVEAPVLWNPPGPQQIHLELRTPRRMINDRTLTIEARILDPVNRIQWNQWNEVASVSVVRLPARTPVAITPTVFDPHQPVPDDAIRLVNGWGSVSFTLDEGAAFAPGDIEVTVNWRTLSASKTVTVLSSPPKRSVSGVLSGAALTWGPDEVIRVAGNCTVPAGSTLRIEPGTLVEVATTGTLENGTLITVQGSVQAIGRRDNPIFFFSERGPAAMKLTQVGSASNGDAWRGFQFYGAGSSTFRYVFLTGAGNGNVVSHPRPPILGLFNTHSILAEYSVFADNCGMVFSGQGTGKYTIRRSLVSRVGIGGEFFGNGHTLRVFETWWTGIGHAPEPNNLDGDLLHVDGPNSNQVIRSCIFNDGGDDGIDHNGSRFRVEHSIITGIKDKSISMTGGHVDVENVLMFGNGTGIRGAASTDHVTIATPSPIAVPDRVYRSIVWPASIATCSGDVDYTDVGNAADLGCGDGNLSTDPMFVDTAGNDYNLKPGSPALTAGPDQDRIGWLGFPYGAVCKVTADCDDGNACTEDTCVERLCVFTAIVGCIPCETDVDCDDGNACTTDLCADDGSCSHPTAPDGTPCDDGRGCTSPDACSGGACTGPESCPNGQHCDDDGECSGGGGEAVTVTFQQGVNGYAGTHDTFLLGRQPDSVWGNDASLWWDLEDPAPHEDIALIRFADVFGSGPGQVPVGATIQSATLTIYVLTGSTGAAGAMHEAWVSWDEATASWGNFGGEPGYQPDEYGPQVAAAPTTKGFWTADVTAQVAGWAFSPEGNNGWLIRANSPLEVQAASSEFPNAAWRPKLTVTYFPPTSGCTLDSQCDDGRFCNGKEKCNLSNGKCLPGTPPECGDAFGCTADSCDEAQGKCLHVPDHAACDDGDACTSEVCDVASGCQNPVKEPPCSDGVACTADSCDPVLGCTFTDSCGAGMVCNLATGACEVGPTVVTFRQGEAGYEGTVDTYVHAGAPDQDNSLMTTLIVDRAPPPDEERQVLLRFEDIFGDGPGQVPPGSPIVSATLTMFVTNPSEDGAALFRMVQGWADTDTWNSLGGGVSTDGVEAVAAPDGLGASNANRVPYDFDVTASVIAWSRGEANLGWVFVMPEGGSDSWQFSSCEELEVTERPRLTISFRPCDKGFAGDGVTCSDVDECGLDAPPCDPNATCSNEVGSYRCTCNEGFEGDGATCTDVDECAADDPPCGEHARCVNEPGKYRCECEEGFEGDGHTCTDVDECGLDPYPCDPNADCVNTEGGFACECRDGYVGDGAACGECPGGAATPCSGHGTCGGTADGPACDCDGGFGGDACEDCAEGWFGPACDQECKGGSENPCNDHGECDDGVGGTGECTCADHYQGDACGECEEGFFNYPDCTDCPECGDGNVCTDDSCDPVLGCVNAPNVSKCDDGNACTLYDTCADKVCVGVPVGCEDGDPCTIDSCDPVTGDCVHEADPSCGEPDAGPDAMPDGGGEGVGPDAAGDGGPDADLDAAGPDDGGDALAEAGPDAVDDTNPQVDVTTGADVSGDATKIKVGGGGGCSATGGHLAPAAMLPLLLLLGARLRRRA